MLDKNYLSPLKAVALLLAAASEKNVSPETLRIEECYGRVLAEPLISPEDLPAFSRSTVDGYAVHSRDTFGAKDTMPAYLILRHEVFMGEAPAFTLKKGEVCAMPTGGMLPDGADSVVMLEHVQIGVDDMIEVMRAVAPGENVIQKGEDIAAGVEVLSRGSLLRAQDIGALAGLGITEVKVFGRPVVALISTGDEIVPASSPLGPGQVRDINSFTLAGLVADRGGMPVKKGIFRDDYSAIRHAVESALNDSHMVLISGGTSAGIKDMTARIINDIGKPGVLFHGVSLKPGKPMIGGVVDGKPILGLPGHPAAAVVCFELFIRPLLERLSGLAGRRIFPASIRARITKAVASAAGREDHIRVAVDEKDGEFNAIPVLGKSGLITTLVKADGTIAIAADKLGIDAGEEVTVKLFT